MSPKAAASLDEIRALKEAIDANDIDRVSTVMTGNPCCTPRRSAMAAMVRYVGRRVPCALGASRPGAAGDGASG